MTKRHVMKYEYSDGVKLGRPIMWCGREQDNFDFYFTGAQHVALNAGGTIAPCKNCIKAIIKQLQEEL